MIPYIPTTKPMTGDEQKTLMDILQGMVWNTPSDRLRVANRIINAGFARRVPQKVSRPQLWSYALETMMLATASHALYSMDRPFIFAGLIALTIGSALTFAGGLVINAGIKKADS